MKDLDRWVVAAIVLGFVAIPAYTGIMLLRVLIWP
jgi:hypothetical protein